MFAVSSMKMMEKLKNISFMEHQTQQATTLREWTCVCNEKAYKQMQILMVRLEHAHKRALETKQANDLNF